MVEIKTDREWINGEGREGERKLRVVWNARER